jgi:hypothetical protein
VSRDTFMALRSPLFRYPDLARFIGIFDLSYRSQPALGVSELTPKNCCPTYSCITSTELLRLRNPPCLLHILALFVKRSNKTGVL